MGPEEARRRWEPAGVGPEVEPVLGPAAGAGAGSAEAVPGPRSRPRRSSCSGCEAEAAEAEAEGRREGVGSGRSLLARLLTDCPVEAAGAWCRAEPGPVEDAVSARRMVVEVQ